MNRAEDNRGEEMFVSGWRRTALWELTHDRGDDLGHDGLSMSVGGVAELFRTSLSCGRGLPGWLGGHGTGD